MHRPAAVRPPAPVLRKNHAGADPGGQHPYRPVQRGQRHHLLLGQQHLLELQHPAGGAAPGSGPGAAGAGERDHLGVQLPALLAHLPGDARAGHRAVCLQLRHRQPVRPPRPGGHAGPGPAGAPRRGAAGLRHPHAALHRPHRLCGRGGGRRGHLGLRDLHRRAPPPGGPGHPHRRPAHPGVPAAAVLFLLHRILRTGGPACPGGAAEPVEVLCGSVRLRRGVFPLLRTELPGVAGAGGQLLRHLLRLQPGPVGGRGNAVPLFRLDSYGGSPGGGGVGPAPAAKGPVRRAAHPGAAGAVPVPLHQGAVPRAAASAPLPARSVRRPGPGAGGPAPGEARQNRGLGPVPVCAGQLLPPPGAALQPPGDHHPLPPAHLHLCAAPAGGHRPAGGPAGVRGQPVGGGAQDGGHHLLLLHLQLQHLRHHPALGGHPGAGEPQDFHHLFCHGGQAGRLLVERPHRRPPDRG